jgi:hypothetical protein
MVERSTGGTSWEVIAAFVAGTSFVDAGLAYATNYRYCVAAVSATGATALSAVASASTGVQADVLSAFVPLLHVARRVMFAGPVASFSDANQTAAASRFLATINWGDGHVTVATVSGAGGSFVVGGRHKYARNGRLTVKVSIATTGQASTAGTSASGTVVVSNGAGALVRARILRRPARKVKAAGSPRG